MQKRINKPKYAPSVLQKPRDYGQDAPKEAYRYQRAYMDEYGVTLVYQRESENPAFRYKLFVSANIGFYEYLRSQGLKLSAILETEIENGYTANAENLASRNGLTIQELLKALKKEGK